VTTFFATDDLPSAAATAMACLEVAWQVSVGQGPDMARVLRGDLSNGYLRINGECTT
jgi:N-acetylglutamate synthase/N-acetylornithine aminotransferase